MYTYIYVSHTAPYHIPEGHAMVCFYTVPLSSFQM